MTEPFLEGVYTRLERDYTSPTQETILDWLRKDSSGNIVREATEKLKEVADELAKPSEIAQEIKSSEDFFSKDEIDDKIDSINSEIRSKGKPKIVDAEKEQRARLLDELREKIRSKSAGFATINTLKKSRRYTDKEATKLIDDRIRELEKGAKSYGSFFREIQSSETRAEADKIVREAEQSEILTEREKRTLSRMAEYK